MSSYKRFAQPEIPGTAVHSAALTDASQSAFCAAAIGITAALAVRTVYGVGVGDIRLPSALVVAGADRCTEVFPVTPAPLSKVNPKS